jgi:hypothetical protein
VGTGLAARTAARRGRRRLAGETRFRVPGLGFGSGFAQGIACAKGNPIRGLRRTTGGRRWRPVARGGAISTARPYGRGEAGERKRNSRRGAVKRRRGGGPRRRAAMAAVEFGTRVLRVRGGGCGYAGPRAQAAP